MMEFLVIAHDRTDDEALARRMAVRGRRLGSVEMHLYLAAVIADSGNGPIERADGYHDRLTKKET